MSGPKLKSKLMPIGTEFDVIYEPDPASTSNQTSTSNQRTTITYRVTGHTKIQRSKNPNDLEWGEIVAPINSLGIPVEDRAYV